MEGLLGELMLRDVGLMRGKGGSMHLTSVEHDVFGSYAIIGAHLPIACGSAWRAQYLGEKDVSVVFFGDGTTISAPSMRRSTSPRSGSCRSSSYAKTISTWNTRRSGTSLRSSTQRRTGQAAMGLSGSSSMATTPMSFTGRPRPRLEKARRGEGPSLIECLTYRHSGHSRADPAKYRPPGELEEWLKRDPVVIYRQRLKDFGVTDETISGIETESKRKVDAATATAKASPPAPVEILTTDVYADGGWAWRN